MGLDSVSKDERDGAAIYGRAMLAVYDLMVVKISNTYAWRCPRSIMLENYNANLTSRHLDIGPGTGWYLDNAALPAATAHIRLMDLNANSLAETARRLTKRGVSTTRHEGSILQPIDTGLGQFDSIAANFVFHCVPGSWPEKGTAFGHIAAALNDDGVFFGSTILERGVPKNLAAKALLAAYNGFVKSFHNRGDDLNGLTQSLNAAFGDVDITMHGTVAVWAARAPRRRGTAS